MYIYIQGISFSFNYIAYDGEGFALTVSRENLSTLGNALSKDP